MKGICVIMKKKVGLFVFAGLLMLSQMSYSVSAKIPPVELKATMTWANSNRVNCHQISAYGKVASTSKKKVAWVFEYRGTDGEWHYQKPSSQWQRFSPNTTVPTLTGKYYTRCDQRLQLNPVGSGDGGKGGVATGYVNIVAK